MSCGLGAVVLVFMLVKHNVDKPVIETGLLEAGHARLLARDQALTRELEALQSADAELERSLESARGDAANLREQLADLRTRREVLEHVKSGLENEISTVEIPEAPDVIPAPQADEEQHLIGLKVEGPRIAILIDASASMTDEKLLDVIRRKSAPPSQRASGPKWRRTLETARWLVSRAPPSSQVMVGYFNDKAARLHDAPWLAGNDRGALQDALSRLGDVVPTGPTNLQAGLRLVRSASPTNLYLVTDGLPTAGSSSYKSLNPFSGCSALWGRGSTISGECRAKLFRHTVDTNPLEGTQVNIVLLPLEGDPEAGFVMWRWASGSGGILISPAESWP